MFFEFLVLKKIPINNTFFSNELISNTDFITFINALVLSHCVAWTLYLKFENIDIILGVEVVRKLCFGGGGDCITKRGRTTPPPEVFQMTVNQQYLCHLYSHYGWCFDIIQTMLHNFHPQRHQKHS